MHTYVVIGAGIAGISAAERIRQHDPHGEIHIFSQETYLPYYRPRLVEWLDLTKEPPMISIHPQEWYDGKDLQLHLDEAVRSINLDTREVSTHKGKYAFHSLILATGATAQIPSIPGISCRSVYTLRNLADATVLRKALLKVSTVLIVGGGFIGLETANVLSNSGKKVIIVEMAPSLLPKQLDVAASGLLENVLLTKGIEFFLGTYIKEFSYQSIYLSNGEVLQADMILAASGAKPALSLLAKTPMMEEDNLILNHFMETDYENVFATGDATPYANGTWLNAREQGSVCGQNAVGINTPYEPSTAIFNLKIAGVRVFSIGSTQGLEKTMSTPNGYCKVITDDAGIIIGGILFGDLCHQKTLIDSIKGKIHLSEANFE